MSSKNLRYILNETKKAYNNPLAKQIMKTQGTRIMSIITEAEKELTELERIAKEAELHGVS